jgi:glycogen debranching enzyme
VEDYQRHADVDLLKWAYPRLKKWHEWWFKIAAMVNLRGMETAMAYLNGAVIRVGFLGRRPRLSAAGKVGKWMTTALYDDAKYDPNTYTMDLDDVGLNSVRARFRMFGQNRADSRRSRHSHKFAADYDRIRGQRQKLWNEKDGMYENRFWDGHFSKRLSPTNFYPMLAGIATPEQAKRMVQEHLLNPREFWGQYVIPTISRTDPAFQDQYYWRGDIWGPTNYLVYEGLDRYGEDEVALQFADKSYQLFMDDWKTHQHTDEQYYAWGGVPGVTLTTLGGRFFA